MGHGRGLSNQLFNGKPEASQTDFARSSSLTDEGIIRIIHVKFRRNSFSAPLCEQKTAVTLITPHPTPYSQPDTTVGIDVALFSGDVIARQTDKTTLIEGVPLLAVELLSPTDRHEEVRDKVLEYPAAGVRLVWIVGPYFQTVQVHQAAVPPETFNRDHRVSGGDVLPGLTRSVDDRT